MKSPFPFLTNLDSSIRGVHQMLHQLSSSDFLIPTENENKMIVHEDEQDANIAVCIQKKILDQLKDLSFPNDFDLNHIQEWCIVFEEISHFHHYCHHAMQNKKISRIQLETQAELDKLYCVLQALETKNEKIFEDQVFSILFDDLNIGQWVSKDEIPLYEQAHSEARRIGRKILSKAADFESRKSLFRELSFLRS